MESKSVFFDSLSVLFEVLEDAHLLSAQRTGEATLGKGAWTKSGTLSKSRVVTIECQ